MSDGRGAGRDVLTTLSNELSTSIPPKQKELSLSFIHQVSRKEMSTDPDILSVLLESES